MKIIALIVAILATTATVSASSDPCSAPGSCQPSGPLYLVSKTTGKLEYVSQCFPWVWLYEYRAGNLVNMYANQKACQEKRYVDFGI